MHVYSELPHHPSMILSIRTNSIYIMTVLRFSNQNALYFFLFIFINCDDVRLHPYLDSIIPLLLGPILTLGHSNFQSLHLTMHARLLVLIFQTNEFWLHHKHTRQFIKDMSITRVCFQFRMTNLGSTGHSHA